MILRNKNINMNDIVISTSKLEPIIVSDRSQEQVVKYLVYHPDSEQASYTCIRAFHTNIYNLILHLLHIMTDLDDLQLLKVCDSFHKFVNDGNWCFPPFFQKYESVNYLPPLGIP